MSLWLLPASTEQPEVTLVCWSAFEVLVPKLGAPIIQC